MVVRMVAKGVGASAGNPSELANISVKFGPAGLCDGYGMADGGCRGPIGWEARSALALRV